MLITDYINHNAQKQLTSIEISSRRIAPSWLTNLGEHIYRTNKLAPRPEKINKILLFKIGAIGDTLLTTPLVRAIRQRYPEAIIDYTIGNWSATALKNNPDISSVISFEDTIIAQKKLMKFYSMIRKLRKNHYDVIFILDRAWQAGVVGSLIGGYTIGFDRFGEGFALNQAIPYGHEPHDQATHDIDMYLALGQVISCDISNRSMVLKVTDRDKQYAEQSMQQTPANSLKVALGPGGTCNPYQSMPERRWSPKQYSLLIDNLIDQRATVILLGDKEDNKIVQTVLQRLKTTPSKQRLINFTGKTTLQQSAAIIKSTDIAIMHDTALMHVASAVNTPTIALFGPTNPHRKKPLGHIHRIIWNNSACFTGKTKETKPCYWENRFLHKGNKKCMSAISVLEVINAINAQISTIK